MNPDEAAALRALAEGGQMTPEAAAVVLCCMICRGPLHPTSKPYYFRCTACCITTKPTDVGSLIHAVRKRVEAALGPTPAVLARKASA